MATWLADPRVEHIGIYEIKDLRPDSPVIGDAPNYHLGLTYADRRPKKAFATLRRLVSLLNSRRIAVRDDDVSIAASPPSMEVFRHLFRRNDGRWLLFLWSAGQARVTVMLPAGVSRVTEIGVDGTDLSTHAIIRPENVELTAEHPRIFELLP